MKPHLSVVNGIDPKLTEEFLLAQPHVADAAVWYTHGHLKAHIVVSDNIELQPSRLIEACATVLGDNQAPRDIEIVCLRSRAS